MIAYADSDWAGDTDSRNSTSGFVISVGKSVISWSSKLQKTVAQSSAEAEYYALTMASNEIAHLTKLSSDFGFCAVGNNLKRSAREGMKGIDLMCDSQGGIALAMLPANRPRIKHMDVKHCLISQRVQKGLIKMNKVDSQDNFADIFTKPPKLVMLKPFQSRFMGS